MSFEYTIHGTTGEGMKLIIDGNEVQPAPQGSTLEDVLGAVMEQLRPRNRALKEVLVDGKPYEEASMGPPSQIRCEDIGELTIHTVGAEELARQSMASVAPAVDAMLGAVDKIAALFRLGEHRQANTHYLQLLETLGLFLQVLQQCQQILGLDLSKAETGGVSAHERLERLSKLTSRLLELQQAQDWVQLADVLEDDLATELKAWRELVGILSRQGSV